MFDAEKLVIVLGAVAVVVAARWVLRRYFSAEARERRRRRRSHGRVVSRGHRPSVRFAVNTGEEEQR